MVAVLHSGGWGQATSDEALLFVAEAAGVYTWNAFLYTSGRFADANLETAPPPAGLLYTVFDDAIYQVQSNGFTRRLVDNRAAATPNLLISPDGRWAAFLNDDRQLWVINTFTGDRQQLAADVTLSGTLAWADAGNLFVGVWLTP